MQEYFTVGKIVNTHGIKGEVRVIATTDFAEDRFEIGNELFIETKDHRLCPVTVKTHRRHKQFDLLSFEEYQTINDVEPFKGSVLKVEQTQLSELPEGEYYYYEIIGCTVVTDKGEELGVVKEILSTGANDVWVVKLGSGKEILIPYIEDVVLDINTSEKQITIHVLEGLL